MPAYKLTPLQKAYWNMVQAEAAELQGQLQSQISARIMPLVDELGGPSGKFEYREGEPYFVLPDASESNGNSVIPVLSLVRDEAGSPPARLPSGASPTDQSGTPCS